MDVGESRFVEDAQHRLPADTVHRGQDNPQILRRGVDEADSLVDVGVEQILANRFPARFRARHVGDGFHRGDGCKDLGVERRHDLRPLSRPGDGAPTEIDLVAVIFRRVVRCRDHDRGVSVEHLESVGGHRCRPVVRHHRRATTGGHGDSRGVDSELLRPVASVVADDQVEIVADTLTQVGNQPGRSTDHHCAVHAVWTGTEATTQTRGTECQGGAETVGEFRSGVGVAGEVSVEECGDLLT